MPTNYLTKPFDAYKNDVKRRAKILLIGKNDCEGDFKLRQNSETAWIGRELTAYLKQRCNINITDKGKLEDRVYVTRGTLTGYLRRHLGLDTLIADIRKNEGKPVFNRKREIMPDGGDSACGSWHKEHKDFDERYDKRSDHRHHAIDAAVAGLVDRSTFMKATRHYKVTKNEYNKPTLKGFEAQIDLVGDEKSKEKLRKTLHNRLYNYVVWHKLDRRPIAGFFDENLYKVEPGTKNLIKRKTLKELVDKEKAFKPIKKKLDLIVGESIKKHIIEEFEARYNRIQQGAEKEKCLEALCGKNEDDGIYYPVGTKNKVKRVRVYHKVTKGVGTFKEEYDKRVIISDSQRRVHKHSLNNDGYACFEIVKNDKEEATYKPIPYHVYWSRKYQARLKNNDKVIRVYKNDTLYDTESREFYVVKMLHASSMQLRCIKTTETMNYGKASKHNKALGKKKKKNSQKILAKRKPAIYDW